MFWDDLRYVLALAESGSLTKASELLGVSRSTVTRRWRDIEAQLDSTLFKRSYHHQITPTDAGTTLINDVQALAAKIERVERKLLFGNKEFQGQLKIAFSDPALIIPFMRLLAVFCERFPNITISILTGITACQSEFDEAEIVIKHLDDDPDCHRCEHLFDFSWAIYDTPSLANDEAHLRTWISWSNPHYFNKQREWLKTRIQQTYKKIEVDSIELCFLSALSGLGRALLPCYIGDNDRSLKKVEQPIDELDTQVYIETVSDPTGNDTIPLFLEFTRMASFRSKKLLETVPKRDV